MMAVFCIAVELVFSLFFFLDCLRSADDDDDVVVFLLYLLRQSVKIFTICLNK